MDGFDDVLVGVPSFTNDEDYEGRFWSGIFRLAAPPTTRTRSEERAAASSTDRVKETSISSWPSGGRRALIARSWPAITSTTRSVFDTSATRAITGAGSEFACASCLITAVTA